VVYINTYFIWLLAYAFVVIIISFFFIKKSIRSYEEYTLANRSLGYFFMFFTYFSTWISGATIIGLATVAFEWGMYQYWFIAVTYIMGGISGPIFLSRIRRINVYTVGDFFALRFPGREKSIRLLVAISMICRNISIVGAQFITIAFFISIGFNINFNHTLIIIAVFIITYTAMSGLWGVAGTDIFQGIIQLIGIPLLLFYIIKSAGGIQEIASFYELIDGSYYLNIFASTNKTTEIFFLLLAPGLFFIIEDQSTWQRIISAKSEKVAYWGYIAPVGAALIWVLVPCFIGVFSKPIFPNFTAYPIALMDFIFSLPQTAVVIIIFAIVSACYSTCDSYLLASGIIFSRDIIQKVFNRNTDESNQILMTRIGIVLCGLLSLYAGMRVYDILELYMLGAYIGGSILTIPYLFAWFSKRMNEVGLITGILCSILTFNICVVVLNYTYSTSMIISMIINAASALLLSSVGKPPTNESVMQTYYFSSKFSDITLVPK
jgi:solute:Na+ symporter, SSS family